MATIDVDWSTVFDFRACADKCRPVTVEVGLVAIPKQVLFAVWPKDDLGSPLPLAWALSGTTSAGAAIVPQAGYLTPDTMVIRLDALTLADDVYRWTLTLTDTSGGDPVITTKENIVLIDCAARCCSARLISESRVGNCTDEVMEDAAKVLALRRAMKSLLACDNNATGAVEMLEEIQAVCRKHNCTC